MSGRCWPGGEGVRSMAARLIMDRTELARRLSGLARRTPAARTQALQVTTTQVLHRIIFACPRDTRRMVRAFQIAGNQAGCGPFSVLPVVKSRYSSVNRQILGEQVGNVRDEYRRAKSLRMLYERTNRDVLKGRGKLKTGRGHQSHAYRKLVAAEARLLKDLRRAVAQKTGLTESSILIYNKGRRVAVTIRPKIYGGRGETKIGRYLSVCTITNLEPHAIIRDRSSRVVAPALAWGRYAGVVKLKREMAAKLGLNQRRRA